MQFSNLALAAFITVGVQAVCPPKVPQGLHHSHHPSGVPSFTRSVRPSAATAAISIPSYSFTAAPVPTTLSSVTTSAAAETTSAAVETTSSSAVVTTSAVATSTSSAAAATSSAASSDSGLTTDESNALAAQNSARSDVGESALTWDIGLVSDAQAWADHLGTLGPGNLVHADQSTEGENLYWSSESSDPYNSAAAAWIAEKSSYSGEAISSGGGFENYGHYSRWTRLKVLKDAFP